MPFAVAHVLAPMIILGFIKKHSSHLSGLTTQAILVGGIAGLLPDIDVALEILSLMLTGSLAGVHRMFTHSILIPAAISIVGLAFWKNRKVSILASAAAFGWLVHVAMDFLFVGEVPALFPLTNQAFGLHLLVSPGMGLLASVYLLSGLDAAIFLLWLWHEEKYKKIKDFL